MTSLQVRVDHHKPQVKGSQEEEDFIRYAKDFGVKAKKEQVSSVFIKKIDREIKDKSSMQGRFSIENQPKKKRVFFSRSTTITPFHSPKIKLEAPDLTVRKKRFSVIVENKNPLL